MWWWTFQKLSRKLRSKDYSIQHQAINRLGVLGNKRALELLIAIVQDVSKESDDDTRATAVNALSRIGDSRAIEPLIGVLDNWQRYQPKVENAVVRALVKFGDASIPHLVESIKTNKSGLKKSAAQVLKALNWQPQDDVQYAFYLIAQEAWQQVIALRASAVEPLLVALGDDKEKIRKAASNALGEIGDKRAIESLIVTLEDKYGDVRKAAADALKMIEWQPNNDIQHAWFAAGLGLFDDLMRLGPLAVAPLIKQFKDPPFTIQQSRVNLQIQAANLLLTILKRSMSDITTDNLRIVSKLDDITDTDLVLGGESSYEIFNRRYETRCVYKCTELRQLAIQELMRRGVNVEI